MADADQVSSTTPNEVVEDEFKAWQESGTVSFNEAAAAHKEGDFFAEKLVPTSFEGSATGAAPFTFESEQVTKLEREDVLDDEMLENKAETKWLEKSNLISVQEPDSTQNDYAFNVDLMEQKHFVTENFAGLEQKNSPDVYENQVTQDQDSVVSTPSDSEDLISEKEVTLETKHELLASADHFTPEVTHTTTSQEDTIGVAPHQEESPDHEFDIITSVKEKVFTEPVDAFRSDFDEKRRIAAEPVPDESSSSEYRIVFVHSYCVFRLKNTVNVLIGSVIIVQCIITVQCVSAAQLVVCLLLLLLRPY